MASAGRHYRASIWLAAQHPCLKYPQSSEAMPITISVLGTQNDRVVKALWDELGGLGFDSWRDLKTYTAPAVENFGCLAIDTHDQKAPVKTTRAPSKPAQFRLSQR